MNVEILGQIAIAGLGVVSAAVPFLSNRANRRTLRDDLARDVTQYKELMDLPELSQAKELLAGHIVTQYAILSTEFDRRRDPNGIGLAIALILIATGGGILSIRGGGWWLLGLIPVAIIFIAASVGLAQDATKSERDAAGKPLEK